MKQTLLIAALALLLITLIIAVTIAVALFLTPAPAARFDLPIDRQIEWVIAQ